MDTSEPNSNGVSSSEDSLKTTDQVIKEDPPDNDMTAPAGPYPRPGQSTSHMYNPTAAPVLFTNDTGVSTSFGNRIHIGSNILNHKVHNGEESTNLFADVKQRNMETKTVTKNVPIMPKPLTVKPKVYHNSPNIHILPKLPSPDRDDNSHDVLDSPARISRLEATTNIMKITEDESETIEETRNTNESDVNLSETNCKTSGRKRTQKKLASTGDVVKTNPSADITNGHTHRETTSCDPSSNDMNNGCREKSRRKRKDKSEKQAQYFGALHRTMTKRVKLTKHNDESDNRHLPNTDNKLLVNSESSSDTHIAENGKSVENISEYNVYKVRKPPICNEGNAATTDKRTNNLENEQQIGKTLNRRSEINVDVLANNILMKRIASPNAYTISLIPHVQLQDNSKTTNTLSTSENNTTKVKNCQIGPQTLRRLARSAIEIKSTNTITTAATIVKPSEFKSTMQNYNETTYTVALNVVKPLQRDNTSLTTTAATSNGQFLFLKRVTDGNIKLPVLNTQKGINNIKNSTAIRPLETGVVGAHTNSPDIVQDNTPASNGDRKRKNKSPQKCIRSAKQTYYLFDTKLPRNKSNIQHGVETSNSQNSAHNLNSIAHSSTSLTTDLTRDLKVTLDGTRQTQSEMQPLNDKTRGIELCDPIPECSNAESETGKINDESISSKSIPGSHMNKHSIPVTTRTRNGGPVACPMPLTREILNHLKMKSIELVKPLIAINKISDPNSNAEYPASDRNNTLWKHHLHSNYEKTQDKNTDKSNVAPQGRIPREHYSNKLTVAQLLSEKRDRYTNINHASPTTSREHTSSIDMSGTETMCSNHITKDNVGYKQTNTRDYNNRNNEKSSTSGEKECRDEISDGHSNTQYSNTNFENNSNECCTLKPEQPFPRSPNPLDHSYTRSNSSSPSPTMIKEHSLIKQYESKYTKPISPLVHSTSLQQCANHPRVNISTRTAKSLTHETKLRPGALGSSTSDTCVKGLLTLQDICSLQSHSLSHVSANAKERVAAAQNTKCDVTKSKKEHSPFALRVGNKMFVMRPLSKENHINATDVTTQSTFPKPKHQKHKVKPKRTPDKNKVTTKAQLNQLKRKVKKIIKDSNEPLGQNLRSLQLIPTRKLKTKLRRASTAAHKITFSPIARDASLVSNSQSSKESRFTSLKEVDEREQMAPTTSTNSPTNGDAIDAYAGVTGTLATMIQIFKDIDGDCTYFTLRVRINFVVGKHVKYHRWFEHSDYPCTLHLNNSKEITQIDIENIKPGFYLVSEIENGASALHIQGKDTFSAIISPYPPRIETLPNYCMAIVICNIQDQSEMCSLYETQKGHGSNIENALRGSLDSRAFKDVLNMSDNRYASVSDHAMAPKVHSVRFYTPELFECFTPGHNNEAQLVIINQSLSTTDVRDVRPLKNNDKSNNCSGTDCSITSRSKVNVHENKLVTDKLPPIYNKAMVLKMKRKQNALFKKCQQFKQNSSLSNIFASLSQQCATTSMDGIGNEEINITEPPTRPEEIGKQDECNNIQKQDKSRRIINRRKEQPDKLSLTVSTDGVHKVSDTNTCGHTNITTTQEEARGSGLFVTILDNGSHIVTRSQTK